MAGFLKRALRIRALQEEIGRTRLAAEMAGLREIERRAEQAGERARESREASFTRIERTAREAQGDRENGATEEVAWGLAMREKERAEMLRPGQESEVERTRGEFLAVRRDRWQVETLVEAASERERREEGKRYQRQMDEWFARRAGGRVVRKTKDG